MLSVWKLQYRRLWHCPNNKDQLDRRYHVNFIETNTKTLLHVFQLRSTFFSQTVSATCTLFEDKGWSCERCSANSSFLWSYFTVEFVEQFQTPL